MVNPQRPRWNHNIHYHRLVLEEVPKGARSALDVGTGNGLLAADLRRIMPEVAGIDVDDDDAVLAAARREHSDIGWIRGDVMTYDFGQTFDVVASVAALHHLPDLPAALQRLSDLTAPGGVMVVVGLARRTRPQDFAFNVVGAVQHRWHSWRRGYWEHSAPTVWPPPHSYAEVQRCAREQLAGIQWKQLPMFRYALTWHRPQAS